MRDFRGKYTGPTQKLVETWKRHWRRPETIASNILGQLENELWMTLDSRQVDLHPILWYFNTLAAAIEMPSRDPSWR
jgi:hypothetical protein